MKLRFAALLMILVLTLGCSMPAMAAGCADGQHTVVIDRAVPATCDTAGRTQGSHCSVCGVTIVQQQIVKMTGHDWQKSAVYVGDGKHSHKCKYCSATWRVHCTLLDQNDCVTCNFELPTIILTEEEADTQKTVIGRGTAMLLICYEPTETALKQFTVGYYENSKPVPYEMEAMVRIPLTEDELSALTDASTLIFHADSEDITLPFDIIDSVLTFRTGLRGTFELLSE